MKKYFQYFLGILALMVVTLGLLAARQLTQQKQETRKEAVSPGGAGKIILDPQTITKYPGGTFATTIKFRTDQTPISAISIRISYPYSGATPELEVVDQNGNPSNQVYPDSALTSSLDWNFPVKSVTRQEGLVTIDLAAINTNIVGFTATTDTPLATIYFKANRAPATNPIVLSFVPDKCKMMTKADPPQDFLDTPVNGSYTIQADTQGPTTVTNLSITNTSRQTVQLSWSAPSDDGPSGKAASYDLRYSTTVINDSNWSSATTVAGLLAPASPNTMETFTVSGLLAGTKYYFALKSQDAAGNISALSNVPNGTTLAASLSFGFKLQGVTVQGVTKPIEVMIKRDSTSDTFSNQSFKSDSNGVFTPITPVALTNISIPATGINADILVKTPGYLRKKLGTITLLPTDNIGPPSWNSLRLKVGDFDDDNFLNIFDIGQKMLPVYTALEIPVVAGNQIYDIDCNGTINILDISLVLTNYTALQVEGDK